MPVIWTKHPRIWRDNAQVVIRAVQGASKQVLEARAPEIEQWMKANAPWTDQTGETRRTLFARVGRTKTRTDYRLIMSAQTPWFKWLELAKAGVWSILTPTLDHWGPIIMEDLRRALASWGRR